MTLLQLPLAERDGFVEFLTRDSRPFTLVFGWGKVHFFVFFTLRDGLCISMTTVPRLWG